MKDEYNYVGFLENATEVRDLLDLPEPPAIEHSVSLFFVEDRKTYLGNFKPLNSDGQLWQMRLRSPVANATIRVSMSEFGQLPEGFGVYVLDEDQFTVVSRSQNSFEIQTGTENVDRNFRVIIGTKVFAERAGNGIPLVPIEFSLTQNYPNPFNPSTTIRYALGKRSHVALEIFNSLGQRVRVLASGEQTTGTYSIAWDGTNANGVAVASGVYVYRLRAGEFTASKKLLLLR